MKGISTHVLDTSTGKPAEGVLIKMERNLPGSGWTLLAEAVTDSSGRVSQLLPPGDHLHLGSYRLRFDVEAYFAEFQKDTFFPEVSIQFEIRDPASHYHVPLLLSPYGYSTYRGS
jgi:5-hydroxyisourate hydrolase